jgi:hypothetical protein
MELNAQQHDPAVLTPFNEPQVPVKHEAGRVGEEKKIFASAGESNHNSSVAQPAV